jgi:hypothetical protein
VTRLDHRRRLFFDRDVLHAGMVAGAACVLSAGLVYLAYFAYVVRTARRAPTAPDRGDTLLRLASMRRAAASTPISPRASSAPQTCGARVRRG